MYYTEAIDSRKFNPSTLISDTPVVFHTADGTPYIPQNFKGEWEGNVQLWYALVRSMNIPSLKVLDGIGFDAAISRAISLLGIPDEEVSSRGFVPGYPIGLGVCSVRPIEMARAFSVIASGGKEITPMAIRTVEDKNGNVILARVIARENLSLCSLKPGAKILIAILKKKVLMFIHLTEVIKSMMN